MQLQPPEASNWLQTVPSPKRKPYHKTYWSKEEDEQIRANVKKYGIGNWTKISQTIPGRNGKQCRERWINHLDPSLTASKWTLLEDKIILEQYQIVGSKWSIIQKMLPGRSANGIRNRYSFLVSNYLHTKNDKHKEKTKPEPETQAPLLPSIFILMQNLSP